MARREPKPTRKTVVRYYAPDGRRCAKGDPGATARREQTEGYYLRLVRGGKRVTVPLKLADGRPATDYDDAVVAAREYLKGEARRAAGISDQYTEAAGKAIADHVEDFRRELLAGEITPKQVSMVCGHVLTLAELAGWKRLGDVSGGSCKLALAKLRTTRARNTRSRYAGRSAQTRNHYLKHVRQFVAWCVDDGRLQRDPLRKIGLLPVEADRRHDRRAPSDAEVKALLAYLAGEVEGRPPLVLEGMSGPQRGLGYRVSMATGLRANELRSLTRESFDLDAGTVRCGAAAEKRRRAAVLHLPPWLVPELREWFAAGGGLWEGFPPHHPGQLLKLDLAAAGVPYEVQGPDGPLFLDFHALRHWYVDAVAHQPGISPKVLLEASRHSDPKLTLKVYSHAREREMRAAAAAVPQPGAAPPAGGPVRENPEPK